MRSIALVADEGNGTAKGLTAVYISRNSYFITDFQTVCIIFAYHNIYFQLRDVYDVT
ncbi:hypothetical protein D3C87_2169240 [compost metagenome]